MSESDMWDDAGPFKYRILPESTLSAFFSEERDMIAITHEMGRWWLGETGVAGQAPYDSLAEAKSAGDERITALEQAQDATLLLEAGLSAEEWRVTYRDGLSFERRDGTAEINADEQAPRPSWDVFAGSNEPVATRLGSMADAIAALGALQPAN